MKVNVLFAGIPVTNFEVSWILRWLRATVPFGGEPLFRSG